MNKQIKPIMIIGAMKSGTSTLFSYLIEHPEICGGVKKELEYFSLNVGEEQFKKGKFEDFFAIDIKQHKYILDASTGYTKYPVEKDVPLRIKQYGLNPKFIYVIRNPFERIRSHYNFMLRKPEWKGRIDSPHLINTSKYYMQLKEYEKVFSKEHIMVLDFEDLKTNPQKVCDEIFRFIGTNRVELSFDENSIKNKTKLVNRKRKFLEEKMEQFSPKFLRKYFRRILSLMFPAKEQKLTESQKKKIKEQLAGDMNNLQLNYGINVKKWGF